MSETITQSFIEFFRRIGIDPFLVFLMVLCVLIFLKLKNYNRNEEKDMWDYIYDTVFFFVAFGLVIFFLLYLFGIIDR